MTHQQTVDHFIPSRPALAAQLLSIKQGSHGPPPARGPFSQGRWTPPPTSTTAKAFHVHYRADYRWRAGHISDTTMGRDPHRYGASRRTRGRSAIFVSGTHRVSLIPSFPGIQALGRGKHATNGRWMPTKGSAVWDGTPSGSNQPSADCRRMRSTAEKTRGCVDGQANLVYNQMRPEMRQCRRWEALETPKIRPWAGKYLCWAGFDQLDPSRLALPYRYLRPGCPTLEACIFSRLLSPE